MNSEIKGKLYEMRGKAIKTEGIINEFTENVLDCTITQKPLTDIIETNEALIIRIDLPGLNKEDLKVDIGEDRVYMKAEFPEENKAEDISYIQKERNHGPIMKSIPLPHNVKPEEATVYFTNSILTVRIPKKHKESYNQEIKNL
ncbi:MAG: Hsp20/alpha crystallin family protein [Methanobacterium sp.]